MYSWVIKIEWTKRQEDYETGRSRLKCHLIGLSKLGKPFDCWFRKGEKPLLGKKIDPLSNIQLNSLMDAGVQYKDIPRRKMPELGCSVDLWNGDVRNCSVTTTVIFNSTSNFNSNSANVIISPGVHSENMLDRAISVLRAIVTCWNPNSGIVTRSEYRDGRFIDYDCAGFTLDKARGKRGALFHELDGGTIWIDPSLS